MFPLIVIAAGFVGTLLMTGVMWFIHRSGWANADMTRAIGSLVTRRYENSLLPGIAINFTVGCIFAVGYLLVIRSLDLRSVYLAVAVGGALGALHGCAMAYILMALVAETHPVERFRAAGAEVAAAHVAGHVAYGIGVGLVAGWLGTGKAETATALIERLVRALAS
jgi:fucose 4-O-acetylase-like acetyltransferase